MYFGHDPINVISVENQTVKRGDGLVEMENNFSAILFGEHTKL